MVLLRRAVHVVMVGIAAALMAAVAAYGIGCAALKFNWSESIVATLAYATLVISILGAGWAMWRRIEYLFIVPTIFLGGITVALLLADDPQPPPADVGRVMREDSPSYAAFRMLVKSDARNRLADVAPEVLRLSVFSGKPEEWAQHLASHRAEIEDAWDRDALGRGWVEAMAAVVPDGLYPLAARAGGWIDFRTFRQIAFLQCAHAQLLASDGNRDEAARALLQFLKANYHLQRGANMLITEMSSIIAARLAYSTLKPLVNSGQLSPSVRSELIAALHEAPSPEVVIRNVMAGESRYARHWFEQAATDRSGLRLGHGRAIVGTGWVYWLLYNPNRTIREHEATMKAIVWLAEQRQMLGLQQLTSSTSSWSWKNPIGTKLRELAMPATGKAIETIWTADDERISFLRILDPESPPSGSTPVTETASDNG